MRGQSTDRIVWSPAEATGWLTKCAPIGRVHEMPYVYDCPESASDDPLPADADIAGGRIQTFDSIDDLLADLKTSD